MAILKGYCSPSYLGAIYPQRLQKGTRELCYISSAERSYAFGDFCYFPEGLFVENFPALRLLFWVVLGRERVTDQRLIWWIFSRAFVHVNYREHVAYGIGELLVSTMITLYVACPMWSNYDVFSV